MTTERGPGRETGVEGAGAVLCFNSTAAVEFSRRRYLIYEETRIWFVAFIFFQFRPKIIVLIK